MLRMKKSDLYIIYIQTIIIMKFICKNVKLVSNHLVTSNWLDWNE